MKHYFIVAIAISMAVSGIAQGNSQNKGKNKTKSYTKTEKTYKDKIKDKDDDDDKDNDGIWDERDHKKAGKISKNQPAKVTGSFQRDYPNASNVTWRKYRGDWTATFNSGHGFGTSTAVYHANGKRRDTRTRIGIDQLPKRTVWDVIFKRDNVIPVSVVQIQSPKSATEIFRIASQATGSAVRYLFYNGNGQLVKYNY